VRSENAVNIEEDSKSSAETSTNDIPSHKYNDAYLGQRYLSNESENIDTNSLTFKPQVLVTAYDIVNIRMMTNIIMRPFYLKSQSILPLILQPSYISIWMQYVKVIATYCA